MSGSGWEAFPDVREWSGGPPGCSREVWRLSRMFGVIRGPSRMSRSGREALPNVQEWSGVSPGCPRVVGRRSWMSGSGRKALPDDTVEAHSCIDNSEIHL